MASPKWICNLQPPQLELEIQLILKRIRSFWLVDLKLWEINRSNNWEVNKQLFIYLYIDRQTQPIIYRNQLMINTPNYRTWKLLGIFKKTRFQSIGIHRVVVKVCSPMGHECLLTECPIDRVIKVALVGDADEA